VSSSHTNDWATAHDASFEVEPLIEMTQGRQAHVGYIVRVFARLSMANAPGADRLAEATQIRAKLEEILRLLAPPAGSRARLELDPARTAAVLAPDHGMQPEIAVSARVFHGEDYFAEVTEGEENRVYAGARRLAETGFKERRRPLR
jgi:hypothetical protein